MSARHGRRGDRRGRGRARRALATIAALERSKGRGRCYDRRLRLPVTRLSIRKQVLEAPPSYRPKDPVLHNPNGYSIREEGGVRAEIGRDHTIFPS
jgi:hypothetical protein